MSELQEVVLEIETVLHDLDSDLSKLTEARRSIGGSLQRLAEVDLDPSLPLAEVFEAMVRSNRGRASREMGCVSIRLICLPNLLTAEDVREGRRHIVRLIELTCPDFFAQVRIDQNAQTHEKFEAVKAVHQTATERLVCLKQPFSSLADVRGHHQMMMKTLNHGPTRDYLNVFGFSPIMTSIAGLLSRVKQLSQYEGYELQTTMQSMLDSIADELTRYSDVPTFIAQDYILPFLRRLQEVALEQQATLADKFTCTIITPNSPYELEKRYPLHVVGSTIQVLVPLHNEGPGVAQDVRVTCIADYCEIQSEETSLGDVAPGPFMLPLIVKVTEPRETLDLMAEIQWSAVADSVRHERTIAVVAKGQPNDLDWERVSLQQPYSLEVAHDQEFYGRKDALRRILRRLAPASTQSCYITGQKRVGKSSLARAVEAQVEAGAHTIDYNVLYLECGELRHSSGGATLNELGTRLGDFLAERLPRSVDWSPRDKDFSASLAPLNGLLDRLRQHRPESRFVVILDEFDEINEDLYRYGDLANTFFLNMRTLSSKRNLAFVLVGAERMPYVMSAQGEKLNKFEYESLNSFHLEKEWADYRAMVETPVEGVIKFHEGALRKLFEVTDGHPYFTKMLCSKVYEVAVDTQDAEISVAEVENAAEQVVETLDVNAFAHYWRDGIRGGPDEVEITSLKRCRVLVAWARAARAKKDLTHDAIQDQLHSTQMRKDEVLPILDDLCRRGVFVEDEKTYRPAVLLFANWLKEIGFTRLVSDQLGDELADVKQKREDDAYVRANEIVELSRRWGLYQGRRITTDEIRAWLEQVGTNVEQRILFKLLQKLRFVDEGEAREQLARAHRWIRSELPVVVQTRRGQQRSDILVSYLDGTAKSGAALAALYGVANEIVGHNVVAPSELPERLEAARGTKTGLVIVDDMIGTGGTLVQEVGKLSELIQEGGTGDVLPVSVVVLCATQAGEEKVRGQLGRVLEKWDLWVGERIEAGHFAFGEGAGTWETDEEEMVAKTLVGDLGARVQRRDPLGFGGQGLLLTFWRNCPNNALPILYGTGKGDRRWRPLFPRVRS